MCQRAGRSLCEGCHADLPLIVATSCPRCALPSADGLPCGNCLRHPPACATVQAALRFAWPVDSLIHAIKYGRRQDLLPPLARFMVARLGGSLPPDAVVAMPMSTRRLRQRGFNQAHELARFVARHYHVPLLTARLRRVDRLQAQAELPLQQRAANVRNAFSVSGELPAHLLIVDDVMTSGSSVQELAQTLLRHGVTRVDAWLLARTYPHQDA